MPSIDRPVPPETANCNDRQCIGQRIEDDYSHQQDSEQAFPAKVISREPHGHCYLSITWLCPLPLYVPPELARRLKNGALA